MTRTALEAQTVAALKKQATELSIKGRSKMKKSALVDAILAASATPVEAAGVEEAAGVAEPAAEAVDSLPEAAEVAAETPDEPTATAADVAEPDEPAAAAAVDAPDEAADSEPVPPVTVEPSEADVYIDRGEAIPESYPGERMRVLVRDPGSLYVYWEAEGGDPRGWEVSAEREDEVLHGFHATSPTVGGYLNAPAADVQRVTVRGPAPHRSSPSFTARLIEEARPAAAAAASPMSSTGAGAHEERWTSFQPPEERPATTAAFPVSSPVPPSVSLPTPAAGPAATSSSPSSHTPQNRG